MIFFRIYSEFISEAISCFPLYLFLFKEKRKRMPLQSGLDCKKSTVKNLKIRDNLLKSASSAFQNENNTIHSPKRIQANF